jgi:hypothetical protein
MFEILFGLAMLWIVWLIASIIDIGVREKNENAHRRAMQGKTKRH